MPKSSLFRNGACAAMLCIATLQAHALPVARIRHVRPVTQVRMRSNAAFVVARERNDLVSGSFVRTLKNGKADVQFSNGTQVVLSANSQLQIVSASSATQPLVIRIFGALSEAFIRPQGDTRVITSAAVAAAPGTAFIIRLPSEDQTELSVTEGEVIFSNPFGQADVFANQRSTAEVGHAPSPPVAVDASGLTQWTADVTGFPVEFEMPMPQGLESSPEGRQATPLLISTDFDKAATVLADGKTFGDLLALSMAERGNGNAPAALETAQQALGVAASDEQREQAKATLALAHLSFGNVAGAKAVLADTQSAIPLAVLGLCALREGDNDGARATLLRALHADTNCYQAHALLCLALLQNNQVADAIREGGQAVQLAPRSAMAHGTLAMALFFSPDSKQRDRALGESRQAVTLNPESPFALLTEGRALIARGQLDAGRDTLQRARAYAPDLPLLDVELGQAYLRLDQLPRAEKAFHRAVLKRPTDASARAGLGQALARQGKTGDAREEYERALAIAPHNAQALGSYARLLIEQGHLKDAEDLLRGGLGNDPDSGLQYVLLSETLLFQQKLVAAGDYARRAVELLPRSAIARYQLGRVYFEQERFGQAEEQFRQAATFDPLFAEARYALGLVREQVEQGLDPTRPLGSAIAVSQSGAGQALSLQNLQTPGAAERIQALLSDPTVARTASRSFGDAQFDSRLGDNNSQQYDLSLLKESDDQRSVMGLTAQRNTTDGVRSDNADFTSDRIGLTLGRKAGDGPIGFFALGQYERQQSGSNFLQDVVSDTARSRRTMPSAFLGFTIGDRADRRTRVLLEADRPTLAIDDIGQSLDTRYASAHAEIRHDQQLGERNLLSIGGGFGQRKQTSNSSFTFTLPSGPTINLLSRANRKVTQAQFYARDEWQATSRLRLTGELDLQRLSLDYISQLLPTPATQQSNSSTVISPLFLAEYQLDRQSSLRFRLRRSLLNVEDFELLAPHDVFVESFDPALLGDFGGRGWGYDLEYDRSFGSGQFLRAALFQQEFAGAFSSLSHDQAITFRGFQLRYEGTLSPTTTFFAGTNYTSAPARMILNSGNIVDARYTEVPRFTGEIGVQFLTRQGWFVQPSFAYIGSRTHQNIDESFSSLGGLGMVNLRVGRRLGLRFSGFAEVLNAGDKKYPLYGNLQPGRQLRFGIINRF